MSKGKVEYMYPYVTGADGSGQMEGFTWDYDVFTRPRDPKINPRTNRPYSETPGKKPFAPIDEEVQFQLVPENDWSAVDAATMGMSTPDILRLQQGLSVEVDMDEVEVPASTGTDTSSGSRETPAPEAEEKPVKRTAADVVKGFGNDFGSMKSTRLSDALRGAQESIIQKRMDAGVDFGFRQTPTTPQTTSDPSNPQDGVSTIADITDQFRTLDFPTYSDQSFATDPTGIDFDSLYGDNNLTNILTYFKDKK